MLSSTCLDSWLALLIWFLSCQSTLGCLLFRLVSHRSSPRIPLFGCCLGVGSTTRCCRCFSHVLKLRSYTPVVIASVVSRSIALLLYSHLGFSVLSPLALLLLCYIGIALPYFSCIGCSDSSVLLFPVMFNMDFSYSLQFDLSKLDNLLFRSAV